MFSLLISTHNECAWLCFTLDKKQLDKTRHPSKSWHIMLLVLHKEEYLSFILVQKILLPFRQRYCILKPNLSTCTQKQVVVMLVSKYNNFFSVWCKKKKNRGPKTIEQRKVPFELFWQRDGFAWLPSLCTLLFKC